MINVDKKVKLAIATTFAESAMNKEYDKVMRVIQNGYTDEEVKTFPIKKGAAEAVIAGTARDTQKAYLEQLEGESGKAAQLERAHKIIEAEDNFAQFSGAAETLRDARVKQLESVEPEDYQDVIDALISDYAPFYQG